jgi:hypothetical protein
MFHHAEPFRAIELDGAVGYALVNIENLADAGGLAKPRANSSGETAASFWLQDAVSSSKQAVERSKIVFIFLNFYC